jgi:hypothetical protein
MGRRERCISSPFHQELPHQATTPAALPHVLNNGNEDSPRRKEDREKGTMERRG